MNMQDEHDDDLEPEVIEGAEVEMEQYPDDEDGEQNERETDVTNPTGKDRHPAIPEEGDASDTI